LNARDKQGEALHEAFRAALLLTGSIGGAEQAVKNAINGLGPDLSAEALLLATARSSVHQCKCQEHVASFLPLELRALYLLSPADRNCFILRFLMGFDREACSEILDLSQEDIEDALHRSLIGLPLMARSIECRRPVKSQLTAREL
jgi:hypothetical protein